MKAIIWFSFVIYLLKGYHINFNVNADKKLHRQALILVRYLSEDIVYFFESMEEYILKADINENILLESNGISISNNMNKFLC